MSWYNSRVLRAVETKDPWGQRDGEPDDAYLRFMQWLVQDPRPTPTTRMATLYDWGGRARAYDKRGAVRGPSEALKRSIRALITVVDLESEKLVNRCRQSDQEQISVRDQVVIGAYLQGLTNLQDMISDRNEIDLSKLSTEDLEKIRDARKRLAKAVA